MLPTTADKVDDGDNESEVNTMVGLLYTAACPRKWSEQEQPDQQQEEVNHTNRDSVEKSAQIKMRGKWENYMTTTSDERIRLQMGTIWGQFISIFQRRMHSTGWHFIITVLFAFIRKLAPTKSVTVIPHLHHSLIIGFSVRFDLVQFQCQFSVNFIEDTWNNIGLFWTEEWVNVTVYKKFKFTATITVMEYSANRKNGNEIHNGVIMIWDSRSLLFTKLKDWTLNLKQRGNASICIEISFKVKLLAIQICNLKFFIITLSSTLRLAIWPLFNGNTGKSFYWLPLGYIN